MYRTRKFLALTTAVCLSATTALAQQVQLDTTDGSISLAGKLIEYDGQSYVIETSLGVLRLKVETVVCSGEACPVIAPPQDFAVAGASEMINTLFSDLLGAYAKAQNVSLKGEVDGSETRVTANIPDNDEPALITLRPENSTDGLRDLLNGDAAIALSTRPLREDERASFDAVEKAPLQEFILGIEGLVFVTSQDNSLASISVSQAADIFSGRIANWSEVGGPDAPINLYTRNRGSGIAEAFDELVMVPNDLEVNSNAQAFDSDAELAETIAADPYGIGFTEFSGAASARTVPVIGACGLVVRPNEFNIQTEEYPLAHRLYAFTTNAEQSDFLSGFLDYLASDSAQMTVADSGAFSQTFTRRAVDQQGMRFASALTSSRASEAIPLLREMVSEMVVSERLSATFRFETGSSELDSRARADITRVADLLRPEGEGAARKIIRVMGFTDGLGNPELNRELSLRRARQVVDALLAADPSLADRAELRPMGFGDVSPIGCDETAKGRWTNRRVELWVSSAPS